MFAWSYDYLSYILDKKLKRCIILLLTTITQIWLIRISHITDVFCKGNQQHADYLLNWIANIGQRPSEPNMVSVVLKSEKSRFWFNVLDIARSWYIWTWNVLTSYHWQKIRLKKKSIRTDPFIQAEAKFRNKLKVRNCSSFVKTSNNDYFVCIDEGYFDRRYFILVTDCSRSNDQEYYNQFVQYCKDPLVYLEVYELLNQKI